MSNHTHHHNHTHNHVHTNNKKVLTISFIIIGLFMIVEILGGIINAVSYTHLTLPTNREE